MSDKCGNCDCADKSQCVKKGNSCGIDIVVTGKSYIKTLVMDCSHIKTLVMDCSYIETLVMDAPAAAEHDGKCRCGSSGACVNCPRGH